MTRKVIIMGKKYTITLVVEDDANEYGDQYTLQAYFMDTAHVVTDALGLTVISTDVKGKR